MKPHYLWLPLTALAFIFMYFGIDKFIDPAYWSHWIPPWMETMTGLDKTFLTMVGGVAEIVIALLVLIPPLRYAGSALMSLYLLFVILTMSQFSATGIRDIGLLAMAAFLALSYYDMPEPKKKR